MSYFDLESYVNPAVRSDFLQFSGDLNTSNGNVFFFPVFSYPLASHTFWFSGGHEVRGSRQKESFPDVRSHHCRHVG